MANDLGKKDEWAAIALSNEDLNLNVNYRVRLGRTVDRVYAAEEFRPVLVLGPQRSYKTSGFAIPAVLEWSGPALVTSVRRDILDDSFERRSILGEVSIFDPAGSLLGTRYETYRRTWNPLTHCNSWDDCVKMGHALTEAGKATAGLQEANFWNTLASQFVAPLLMAARQGNLGFAEVVRWIKNLQTQYDEVWPLLEQAGNESALDSYRMAYSMEERTRSSVFTTLWSAFRVFDYEQVVLDPADELDVSRFLDSEADTLYICAPPDDQEEYRPQFTAVVRTVLRETYSKNSGASDDWGDFEPKHRVGKFEEGQCPLLVLLDEAGNIAALENLGTLATTAAGTSIQLVCIFHDISQIEQVYGTYEAKSIINNHSAFVVLPGCRDSVTLNQIEMLLRGERVAYAQEAQWNGPRQIRSMRRGTALLVYENLRPIVLSLRSKFTDPQIAELVDDSNSVSGIT